MNRAAPQTSIMPGRRAGLFALALFVLLFAVYAATGSKRMFGYEGQTIAQTEALLTGKTTPRPGLGGFEPFTQGGLLDVAAYVPFSAVKLALERSGRLFGLRQLVYPMAIPCYTALLMVIFFFLALELYRDARTAAGLTLITALATMLWPYAKFGMETQQTLWTLAGALALVRYQRRGGLRPAAALGFCLAALMLTKITGSVNAAALGLAWGVAWLRQNPEGRRRPWGELAWVAALGAAGVIVFLLTNRWRYGGWVFAGRYGFGHEASPYPLLSGVWAACFSPGKSLFLFSPVLVAGLWFWAEFWRRFPGMRLLLVFFLLIGLWHIHMRPWADETWGPRRLHYLVLFLALPLGIWIERRGALRRWVHALGLGTLALGLWVQFVAIAFDYTALARVVGGTDLIAIENTVWQPQLSPIGFNLHLLASAWHRRQTGRPLPYIYELHFMPWTAPPRPPAARVFSLKGEDTLDFWVVQQRADWAGRPYWFHAGSFFLWLGLVGAALGAGACLYALARSDAECRIRNK